MDEKLILDEYVFSNEFISENKTKGNSIEPLGGICGFACTRGFICGRNCDTIGSLCGSGCTK